VSMMTVRPFQHNLWFLLSDRLLGNDFASGQREMSSANGYWRELLEVAEVVAPS
jgi:hypothetical protein